MQKFCTGPALCRFHLLEWMYIHLYKKTDDEIEEQAYNEDGVAFRDAVHGPHDVGLPCAFEQVSAGAGLHRGKDGVVVFDHAQHDDADVRAGAHDAAGGLDAVDAGHVEVHRGWIQLWNADPKPFVWKKTAEEILTSLSRYISRISGAGH